MDEDEDTSSTSSTMTTDARALRRVFESFGIRVRVTDEEHSDGDDDSTVLAEARDDAEDDREGESVLRPHEPYPSTLAEYHAVKGIVQDTRWPIFLERLWFAIVNAGGGTMGAVIVYRHYAASLPFRDANNIAIGTAIADELFTAFGATCPKPTEEILRMIGKAAGQVASNGADIEASFDHLVWSIIFFVGTATLVAFPFVNYASGGRVDARKQLRIISLGFLSAFGSQSLKEGTALFLDNASGPLAPRLSEPRVTARVPRINRMLRFYERSDVYPSWAIEISSHIRGILETRREVDCGEAQVQKLLEENRQKREEELKEEENMLTTENNRLLKERLTGDRGANIMNGLFALGQPAIQGFIGMTARRVPSLLNRQFASSTGDAELNDAAVRREGSPTMEEYLDFLANLVFYSIVHEGRTKTQTKKEYAFEHVYFSSTGTPNSAAEAFLDALNAWNNASDNNHLFDGECENELFRCHHIDPMPVAEPKESIDRPEDLFRMKQMSNVSVAYGRGGKNPSVLHWRPPGDLNAKDVTENIDEATSSAALASIRSRYARLKRDNDWTGWYYLLTLATAEKRDEPQRLLRFYEVTDSSGNVATVPVLRHAPELSVQRTSNNTGHAHDVDNKDQLPDLMIRGN